MCVIERATKCFPSIGQKAKQISTVRPSLPGVSLFWKLFKVLKHSLTVKFSSHFNSVLQKVWAQTLSRKKESVRIRLLKWNLPGKDLSK